MDAIWWIEWPRPAGLRPRPTAFGLRPAGRKLQEVTQFIEQSLGSTQ